MDLLWLRYFVAVAEELSFTKAAARFGIAQPPLSRHIQELEDELGTELFIRDRRHVELTDVGQALLPEARVAISAFDHSLQVARRASRGEVGTVRIAISNGLSQTLETVMEEHRKRAPEVTIEYSDMLPTEQNVNLRERKIDVGFLWPPVSEHLNFTELFSEQLYALLPRRYGFQGRKSIRLEEIAGEPVLLNDPRVSQMHSKILELYASAAVRPGPIRCFMGSRLSEANQLRMKTDETICFGTFSNLSLSQCRLALALDEPDATYPVYLAWRKEERSAAVLSFVDSVRKVFKQATHPKRKGVGPETSLSTLNPDR